jgi:hypothetical protein
MKILENLDITYLLFNPELKNSVYHFLLPIEECFIEVYRFIYKLFPLRAGVLHFIGGS